MPLDVGDERLLSDEGVLDDLPVALEDAGGAPRAFYTRVQLDDLELGVVRRVVNPEPAEGLSSSVRLGLRALELGRARSPRLALGDESFCPRVQPQALVVDALERSDARLREVATAGERIRGTRRPVRAEFSAIASSSGSAGSTGAGQVALT